MPPMIDDAGAFVRLSRALLLASLDSPPADIEGLRRVELPAMGNIAGRLQASLLLLAIAEVMMNARARIIAAPDALDATLDSLAAQLARYARWIEMAGMAGTAGWLRHVDAALHDEKISIEQVLAGLGESLIAVGRLRFWAEAISPWHNVGAAVGDDDAWLRPGLV